MDLELLRVFVKVAEQRSFTRAAEQLEMPKSRVSTQVAALEAALGTRLFQRSTRVVELSTDGAELLPRAERLLAEADELGAMFHAPRTLRGTVRVDLPINLARDFVIPRLPELFATYPQLEVLLSTTDRRVDLLREGFDCVVRVGALADSTLVARRIGVLELVNCVSAGYAKKHGVPRTLEQLDEHHAVHYSLRFGADTASFEWHDGAKTHERPMKSLLTVNNADAYRAACLAGLGLIQAPRIGVDAALATGLLLEVLPDYQATPMPVSLVHPYRRGAPQRVRAVMAWLAEMLGPRCALPATRARSGATKVAGPR